MCYLLSFNFDLQLFISYLLSSVLFLLSSIFYLLSSMFLDRPSAAFHLLSSSIFDLLSSTFLSSYLVISLSSYRPIFTFSCLAIFYIQRLYLLDFNRAYNPYCAYNATYECPYPPPSNRLKVRIEAGERTTAGPPEAAAVLDALP